MRRKSTSLIGCLSLVAVAAGCNSASPPATQAGKTTTISVVTATQRAATGTVTSEEAATRTVKPVVAAKIGAAAPDKRVEFGHIVSLRKEASDYVLRFDPAEYLAGRTAADAMEEDTGQSDVANDSYVVDESGRSYTYLVPRGAEVSVLADGVDGTHITVPQLAKLVRGKNPLGHPLFEPLETGFWILIEGDAVTALDQQYVP